MESLTETLTTRFNNEPAAAARLIDMGGQLALNLLLAAVILTVTFWLSGFLSRLVRDGVKRFNQRHSGDTTLSSFAGSVVRYAIWIIGLIAVFQQLGVQTTSILAVLGAASLAIGLALQGALSNVAAGVMLLILRPYRVGDVVELNGRQGKVRNLDLFQTEITSFDGLRMVMPNAKVLGEMIINYTTSGRRRMELHFGVDYADDLDRALALLVECADADPRILQDPAPWAKVTALGDSAVQVTLRAWASDTDYANTWPDLTKAVKETFEANGLSFPYPHQVAVEREELKSVTPANGTPSPLAGEGGRRRRSDEGSKTATTAKRKGAATG